MAKGMITSWSCDLNPSDAAYNGFLSAANETDYVLGTTAGFPSSEYGGSPGPRI
jgi:hypothetical protein